MSFASVLTLVTGAHAPGATSPPGVNPFSHTQFGVKCLSEGTRGHGLEEPVF